MELPARGVFSTIFGTLLGPIIDRLDRRSLAQYDGELKIPALAAPVHVAWDEFAIPHVTAANEEDLFLAQGYLHAQERLWQMELSRRFLAGRMAELFGDFTLPWKDLSQYFRGRTSADFDYFIRVLGIRHAALADLDQLAEPEQLRLRAYCHGVNAYIEKCGKNLPWEFRVLRLAAEPWRPEDSLTIGKGLSLLLSTALYTRLNFIAVADRLKAQPEKLRALMPRYPFDAPTITRSVCQQASNLWQFTSGLLAGTDWHAPGNGSNNWLVAPHRSVNGGAILCNDPHLRLTLPSTWYLMHLKAASNAGPPDAYEVWGASIPGIPCIQLGHNGSIAWGATAALCDDIEIYREKLHRLEPERYRAGHEWHRLASRREIIAVRGQAPRSHTVRHTRHGPVLSDLGPSPDAQEILSVRWTALEPSQELRSVYRVNRARDWREFLDALRDHGSPTLNFLYADCKGNVGYSLAGKIPRRQANPTLLPSEGWDPSNDWQGYIPFDELPRAYNPPSGTLATANNRVADGNFPYYLSHFYEPPHRIRRIEQQLGAREKFAIEDLAAMQLDQTSLHAKEFIDMIKEDVANVAAESALLSEAVARLLAWDGDCSVHSVAASIFHVLHHRFLANLLAPDLGEPLFCAYVEILNQCIVPTDRIVGNPQSPWFRGRSRRQLIASALREACAELASALGSDLENWQWGKVHRLEMNHALSRLAILKPRLSIGPFAAPGDGMTLNMGFYRHSNPYGQSVGASLRFIVDFSDGLKSRFVLASGQSGHPSSRHYRDQTALWRSGKHITLCDAGQPIAYSRRLLIKPL